VNRIHALKLNTLQNTPIKITVVEY